ncbi:dienelactone hydrolase family protein [Actinopolymorpha pittospori]|uniref:Dienelactone hydrolase n=1 Tax=Actinopolymorpha pittospori TaxID=648752 RepID=A0A927RAE1_9ACTN|nr:hypothetical protein [Actinopolymorpha pittospori]MBE1604950.1 dienelactone hydrolase [Actinopolymorpha pittospori]
MEHLGAYQDMVELAEREARLRPQVQPGQRLRAAIADVLGFSADVRGEAPALPGDIGVETSWERDGVAGEELSWSVGYGPRTHAYVLKPAGATGPLPGVVALHSHDGVKTYGKEKIADGPDSAPAAVRRLRDKAYGGRAFANALAAEGFVVVVPDAFLWSSRRFPVEAMPARVRALADHAGHADGAGAGDPEETYERAARLHEDLVAKYATVLGTSVAGLVARDDRAAAAYLRSRPDVAAGPLGCVGLSGGGCRAALLQATCDDIGAAVVVGMMSTHAALLDRLVDNHTWMFFPPGLARLCDWPDLAASRAPSPLLVQYDREDDLFTLDGMRAADAAIAAHYQGAGRPDAYVGEFYDGPHKFDLAMQASAFSWLGRQLAGARLP